MFQIGKVSVPTQSRKVLNGQLVNSVLNISQHDTKNIGSML